MANVYDYIRWRGDLGFDERPFCEIDSLVLCQLSYIDMRAVFPRGGIPADAASQGGIPADAAKRGAGGARQAASRGRTQADAVDRGAGGARQAASRGGMLTVREAVEALLDLGGGQLDTMILNGEEERAEYTAFAKAAADSRRFGPLLMEQYVDVRDKEKQTQFSAVTFRLDPRTGYVAFRGTDDSLVGWKEDFMLSFERIPAQDAALEYLMDRMEEGAPRHNNVSPAGRGFPEGDVPEAADGRSARTDAEDSAGPARTGKAAYASGAADDFNASAPRPKRFHVGGHSKGANLALYAAALLPKELQRRLVHVHLYDGPGLCPDVPLTVSGVPGTGEMPRAAEETASSKQTAADIRPDESETASDVLSLIAAIDPIATKIVPEYDIVGKIFEMPVTDNRIVKSSAEGVNQHAITTWQLLPGGELDLVPQNAPGSIWIGKALDAWIGGVDNESRKIFIDELFNVLGAGGDSLNDLSTLSPETIERILSEVSGISPTTIDVAVSLPIAAATGVGRRERTDFKTWLLGLFRHNTYSRALLLLAAGACCFMLPGSLLPLTMGAVLTVLLGYEIVYYVKRLRELHWDFRANSTQGFLCLASILVYAIILIKEGMLTMLSNIVYGGLFLFLAYHIFKRLSDDPDYETLPKPWSIAEGVALILLAVLVLIVPTDAIAAFTIALGSIFLLDGIAQFIHVHRIRRRQRRQNNVSSGADGGGEAK